MVSSCFNDLGEKRKKTTRANYFLKIDDGLMADLGPELRVTRPPTRHKAVQFAFKRSERWRGQVVL